MVITNYCDKSIWLKYIDRVDNVKKTYGRSFL